VDRTDKDPLREDRTLTHSSILVADDEQLIRWSLRERLERAGFRVLEAENGKQALDHFQEGVDLVLLDLKLPDADGLLLLKKIKDHSPSQPVILMTAFGTQETVSEALRSGAYRVVDKPFDFDRMVRLVREALQPTSNPELP